MNCLFMKNGLYGKYHEWKLYTAFSFNGIIEFPKFDICSGSNKSNCRMHIKYWENSYYNASYAFNLEIIDTDEKVLNWCYYTTVTLKNESNEVLHIFSELKPITCHIGQYVLGHIDTSTFNKLKCNHEQIIVSLYIVQSTVLSEQLKLNFYQDQLIRECCGEIITSFEKCFIEDNLFSDAVIVSKNKEFKINKNIFSARSKYFSAAFKHETCEKKSNKILIKNKNGDMWDDEVVEKLIRYVYTGRVNELDKKIVFELLEIAHMYMMPNLEKICISYLKKNINEENFLNILKICKHLKIEDLTVEISKFITRSKTYGMECTFLINSILWRCEPYEIESQQINTKDAKDNVYEFKLKIKKINIEYCLDLELLGNNVNSFSAFVTCGFLNFQRHNISHPKLINILPNKPLESIFPVKIFSENDIASLLFQNDKLVLNFFIWNQYAVDEVSVHINEDFCLDVDKKSEFLCCEVLKDISNLYNDKTYSDFKIKTSDKEFNVHKNILAANSSVFFSILCTDDQKNDESLFIDIKTEAVEVMLKYLYTGATDKFSENIIELFELAEEYGFHRLKDECEQQLLTNSKILID